jgi:hypothetical protein
MRKTTHCRHSTPEERGEKRYRGGDYCCQPPQEETTKTAVIRSIAQDGEVRSETIEVSSDATRAIGRARAIAREKAKEDPRREYHAFVRIEGSLQWLCGYYFGPLNPEAEPLVQLGSGETISRGPGILNPRDIGLFVGDRRRPLPGHTGGY